MPEAKQRGEHSEITIDFILKNRRKVRLDLASGKAVYLEKVDRQHMDLLYQGKYLRFTTCLEKEAPCDLKNVGKDNIKSIRLKMRTSFYFQFMEFCFTEILQLTPPPMNQSELQGNPQLNQPWFGPVFEELTDFTKPWESKLMLIQQAMLTQGGIRTD